MHQRQEERRKAQRTGLPLVIAAGVAFFGVVFLLTKAAVPIITALSVVSFNEPRVYAALLAMLVALPGLLFTMPRATKGPEPYVPPSQHRRRERPKRGDSFVVTDALGLVALLVAQVPIPAPWASVGKAATVANVTRSAEIVQLSHAFAWPSIGVFAAGIVAAVIAHVYRHAPGLRVIAIILAVGAPAVGWFFLTRTVLT
jgi:hypothetical protein